MSYIKEDTESAANNQDRGNGVGPLKKLDQDKYGSDETLMYPLDIGKYAHYIKFNINAAEKSKYAKNLDTSGAMGTFNANLKKFINNTGLVGKIGVTAAGVGTAAISSAGGALSALSKGNKSAAYGQLAKGAGIGLVSGSVLASIDMSRKTKRLLQTIFLYVPDTIQNQLVAAWDATSMLEAMGNAGLVGQGADAVGGSISSSASDMTSGSIGAGAAWETAIAAGGDQFGNKQGVLQNLLKKEGIAQNPMIDVQFKQVQNREFQFDFKFTPTSKKEAEQCLKIIKMFRFHAAPELISGAATQRYLIPPSEFDIDICFNGNHNSAIHKISTCVLEGIDVNYVTAGQFATFDDGIPVEIAMTLKFKEVELMHKALIEEGY